MGDSALRIGTWNVLHGVELSSGQPATADQLLERVSQLDCDLLGIQEVDQHQPRSLLLDQTEVFAQALGAAHFRFEPSLAGTPGENWQPHHDQWDGPRYGIGLISRLPVKRWHVLRLAPARIGLPLLLPTPKGPRIAYVPDEPRVALAAELDGLTVANVHLSFVPGRNIGQLRQVKRWLLNLPGPRLLLGDFNLPGYLPARVSGWRDLARIATYPSWRPRAQFDHILSEREMKVLSVERPQTGLSDHLPLIVATK